MRFGPIAGPHQVEAMAHVLATYCKHMAIDPETPEGQRIASVILALHEIGVREESELLKALIVPRSRLPRGAHWR